MKLKHWIQVICGIAAPVLLLLTIGWSIVRWYQNPDMTQMRLFITYWKEFVTPLGASFILYTTFHIKKG